MTLIEITKTLRDLADRHVEINGFYTGLNFEVNDSVIQYPALRMIFPYSLIPLEDEDELSITFKLTMLVNSVDYETGSMSYEVNTNYDNQQDTLNEIDSDIVDETLLREKALQIMAQYLEGLRMLEDELEYFVLADNYTINSEERVNNDKVTGVSVDITLTFGNDYKCQAQANVNNTVWKDENGNLLNTDYIIQSDCPECPPIIAPTQYSMEFNGVNAYVIANNVSAYNDFEWNKPFSFTQRVKITDVTSFYGLIGKRNAGFIGFVTFFAAGQLRLVMRDTISTGIFIETTSLVISNNTWITLGFSYDGSGDANGVKMYANGIQQTVNITSNTLTGSIITTQNLTFGESLGFYLDGKIAYTRGWNIELSAADMVIDHNGGPMLEDPIESANLVVGWKSGQDALKLTNWAFPDESGNNFDPVLNSQNMTYANRSLDVPS